MSLEITSQERIIHPVKRLEVPQDQLVVVGGAALELFGIKQTKDIDVVVSASWITKLLADKHKYFGFDEQGRVKEDKGALLAHAADVYSVATYGPLSVMTAPNDALYQATFEELRDEAVEIEGLLVSPPERILAWKQAVGREKDAADIQLIEQYMAQNLEQSN